MGNLINDLVRTMKSLIVPGLTVTGLSANQPVITGDTQFLDTISYSDFKGNLSIVKADVSGLHNDESPTFAALKLTGGSPTVDTLWISDVDGNLVPTAISAGTMVGRSAAGHLGALGAGAVLGFLLASTTDADIPYFSAANTLARLPIGSAGQLLRVKSDLSQPEWATVSAPFPPGHVYGLESSNAADTDHDITITVGGMKDTTSAYDLVLASAMTKQIDASWAAGTNQGGLFSGTVANGTIYYRHLIRKDSDGTIDWGFDTSATAANKPAGYTAYAVMGYELTNASANILNSDERCYGNLVHKTFRAIMTVASGLTSTNYAAQSLAAVVGSALTEVSADLLMVAGNSNYGHYLSTDGVNYYRAYNPGDAVNADDIRYIPIIANQVYYKIVSPSDPFYMKLWGVKHKR